MKKEYIIVDSGILRFFAGKCFYNFVRYKKQAKKYTKKKAKKVIKKYVKSDSWAKKRFEVKRAK